MTAYTEALQSGSTTLCRCFRLVRNDGTELGFTDHDMPVTFGGLTYAPETALTASEASTSLGMRPDELDASGALSSEGITEGDLVAGLYDGAGVEMWDVDWRDPDTRQLLGRYSIGEVERSEVAFKAELRSLAAALDRKIGRVHSILCDVRRLGDHRCKLDLTAWQSSATVLRVEGMNVVVSGLDGFEGDFWNRGILTWLTGANASAENDIRLSWKTGTEVTLALWRAPVAPIEAGDTLTATAGCDRSFGMCSQRFGNGDNHRGFPHMTGDTFLSSTGEPGAPGQNGGSRFA